MANIPTDTDLQAPYAPQNSTRAEDSPVGAAVERFGSSLTEAGSIALEIKNIDDARWATEQYIASKDQLAQFKAQPEVAQSEDIANLIKNQATSIVTQVDQGSAPSPDALRMYKDHFTAWSANEVSQAYDNGFQNKVTNTVNSTKAQIDQAIATFRTTSNEPKSLNTLVDSVAATKGFISKAFDKFSPTIAQSLNAYVTTQTVLATAKDNPEAAASFLKSDNTIDEQTRWHLENEINTAAKVKDASEVFQFNKQRDNNVQSAWDLGTRQNPLTLDTYEAFLGPEQGKIAKSKDDEQHTLAADHYDILTHIAGWSEPYLNDTLANLTKMRDSGGPNAAYNNALYEATAKSIQDNIHLQRTDVSQYVTSTNPHVKSAYDTLSLAEQKLASMPDDTQAKTDYSVALSAYNDTQLLYQGAPPTTTDASGKVILAVSPDDAKLYLGKSQNEQSLLSNQKAEDMGKTLAICTPDEFIDKTRKLLAGYTDDTQAMIAFNDLVTKGKLSQQYQLAWLNKDASFVNSYLGALKAGSAIKLSDADQKTIESAVTANPNVANLTASMIGDNSARAKELEGFTTGIGQWAKVIATSEGKTLKDAANTAADKLIGTNLGFTKVNGKPLMILRDDGQGNKRSDADIADIGRRLEFVPQFMPLSQISLTNDNGTSRFPTLDDVKPENKLTALSNHIAANSFWQVGPDGQSASMYIQGADGPFQLTDKNKQPFIVKFSDLPSFAPVQKTSDTGLPGQGQRTVTEVPGVRTASLFKHDTLNSGYFSGWHYSGGMRAERYPGVTENNTDKRPSWMH